MLSVIIPSYNEENNIINTADTVTNLLDDNGIEHEIVFVNDGSTDSTWDKMSALANERDNVTSVNFSRNFGKESAIFAGLEVANGDACVLMDCDLQHPAETIVEMYNVWKNNDVDIVEGRKKNRGKENCFHRFFSLLFYRMINKSSGLDMDSASDFKLLDRRAVDALNNMPERLTFFRAMSSWVGFKTEQVYFEVAERENGKSKWTGKSLFRYAVSSITSFTSAPLHLVTIFGIITFIISVVLGVDTLYNKIWGNSEAGFPTVIILQLLTTSIIMFSLGIIGYYISKIYEEIKNRPRYIIKEIVSKKKDNKEQ
ncbi:MAG: glycosyltransferase family 2 protein [Ruminococcus sp.]|nr:glycosyltransferase family 2 protein [Ruminococcus sp.]